MMRWMAKLSALILAVALPGPCPAGPSGYPAVLPEGAERETYIASLPSEPPASPANFTFPGIAVRGAPPAGKGFRSRRTELPLLVTQWVATACWLPRGLARSNISQWCLGRSWIRTYAAAVDFR